MGEEKANDDQDGDGDDLSAESPEGKEQAEVAEGQYEDAEQEPFIEQGSIDGIEEDKEEPGKIEAEKLILRDRR